MQAAFAELGGTIENLEILLAAYSDVVHEAFGSDTISDKITVISRAIAEAQIRMEGVDKATQDYVNHILAAGDQKIAPTIQEPNVPSGAGAKDNSLAELKKSIQEQIEVLHLSDEAFKESAKTQEITAGELENALLENEAKRSALRLQELNAEKASGQAIEAAILGTQSERSED